MSPKLSSKLPVYIFTALSVFFLGLTVAAFGVLHSYQDTITDESYDESGMAAVQLRIHYEALMGALAMVELSHGRNGVDEAVLQFDILYERIQALPSRPGYEFLLDDETLNYQARLLNEMRGYLPRIDRAADGDGEALVAMHGELASLRPIIERLGHRPVQLASEIQAELTRDFRQLSDLFLWVIGGFVFSGLLFSAIIWRQLNAASARQVELETLTRNLQIARDEAEAASSAKTDFLAHMSHELRTPMNSILGFAQLLQAQNLDGEQTEAVDQIVRSGGLLMHMIDQVLELNKIMAGRISVSVHSVVPADVVARCLSLMDSLAADRSITLRASPSIHQAPDLKTDPNRLQQALLNLMSNAIKYNHLGGEVTLNCTTLPDEGNGPWLRFSVQDTGEGVPEGRERDLFKPFNRLGRETMNVEGTGIGLTITQELVRILGGRIGFISTPGQGSTFWIDLPVEREESLAYEE